jgi:hypothetical protein
MESKIYKCNYCDKEYSSSQSRSNHYILKHREEHLNYKNDNKNRCIKCNKELSCKQSKYRHEKKCIISSMNKKEEEHKIYEKIIKELLKQNKTNIKNINNGTINNNITINNIIKFGDENINDLLSRTEKINILCNRLLSLEESVKTVHLNNKYKNHKNIIIKNLKDPYAYVWDGTQFIVKLKEDVLEDLINNHVEFIEASLNNYKNFLAPDIQQKITYMLEQLESSNEFVHKGLHKTFKTYKTYKKEMLKLLIYNNTKNETLIVLSFENNLDLDTDINTIED